MTLGLRSARSHSALWFPDSRRDRAQPRFPDVRDAKEESGESSEDLRPPDRRLGPRACERARKGSSQEEPSDGGPGCTFSSAHVENVTAAHAVASSPLPVRQRHVSHGRSAKNVQMGSMRPCASLFLDRSSPTGNVFGKRKRSTSRSEEKRDGNRWERRNNPPG